MKILVLGSSGREHAMACALQKGGNTVLVAPGNGGTPDRRPVDPCDPAQVVDLCRAEKIDLVLIGPESALAAGVSDALLAAGLKVFGPSRAAARLETSKSWCRAFAARHGISSPRHATFDGPQAANQAIAWAGAQDFPVVVKADGLASGKGVIIPETTAERDAAILQTSAVGAVVLEERLAGSEISLLVFTDGQSVAAMPPAQDHKRLLEGDRGPNTGGMGACVPSSACPPAMVEQVLETIIRPTLVGLAQEGLHYVGVLYAGLIISEDGPRLIEYNCRFGDPEAQALLPLLATPLCDIALACIDGQLDRLPVDWLDNSSCNVVIAAPGYPQSPTTGMPITGLSEAAAYKNVHVFHANTEAESGAFVTAGGRVLSLTATGRNMEEARNLVYAAVSDISFEGCHFRRDIGWRELASTTGGYAVSGVDIDEGARAVKLMRRRIEAKTPVGLSAHSSLLDGVLDASALKKFVHPMLVSTTDGVGTKATMAAVAGSYDSIGHDIVNHCTNDLLTRGAVPLLFQDYIASPALPAHQLAQVVDGMAAACRAVGCALLGGETAHMPGVYQEGALDVVGTMVGVVERSQLLPRSDIKTGDILLGLASSGVHTNGYSLVRRIFRGLPLDATPYGLHTTIGDALLIPHRSYLNTLLPGLATDAVKALIHVTGGGVLDNLPRALPAGHAAEIDLTTWPVSSLFALIREISALPDHELFRTFNMGIGMIVICAPDKEATLRSAISEELYHVGCVVPGNKTVTFR